MGLLYIFTFTIRSIYWHFPQFLDYQHHSLAKLVYAICPYVRSMCTVKYYKHKMYIFVQ